MQERSQLNVRVPSEVLEWARQSAKEDHRSLASFITAQLCELKRNAENKKKEVRT